MSVTPAQPDPTHGVPDRLIKHSVRYADHRAVDRTHLTPMMRHYADLKDQYPHAILVYRVGDFYETFFQDALIISRELEIVLTSKDGGKEVGRVPLSGIPHHALDRYSAQLVEKGYAIAVCDQVEDPAEAQGLVRREITRVITPGTILEEGMLNAKRNNFLAAIVLAGNHWGLSYADISTGEFLTTQSTGLDQLASEIARLQPAEVLIPTNAPDLGGLLRPGRASHTPQGSPHLPAALPTQFCYTLRSQTPFSQSEARQRLLERFKVRSLEGMGCEHLPLAVRAAGGLLEYIESTSERNVIDTTRSQPSEATQVPLQAICTYTITEYLTLDPQTRRNLEITQTVRDGIFHGSLLWALDRTETPMGSRALRRWLLQPLLDITEIEARQNTIQELVADGGLREDLKQLLHQIYDLERLAGRAGSGTATPRDLVNIAESLSKLPELARLVARAKSSHLRALQQVPALLEQLGQQLLAHLVERPPISVKEGGLIRSEIVPQLDQMRSQAAADEKWLAELEKNERDRTGIQTLKVGYNKAFGYFISISRAKADQYPEGYERKQTLTNEERFTTDELKARENRIMNARRELSELEYDVFVGLRSQVGEQADLIRKVAHAVAAVDALTGLAELAVFKNFCRPKLSTGRGISIVEGRHPVVEQSLPAGFFVPNSAELGTPCPDLIVLTGPNASGKSCYLRQIGLIQLLAQMGSFVPAESARLGICDRIFTRVGAVDDLATGQSTFMVEMNETANILNHATDRSLVLLDEIGRGTATFDGLSIAWAVAEHLATEVRSRTIFATHYHELNELASILPNVANYQVTVREMPEQIIFLHKVQPGGADRSYGIEAGRLAGLPSSVIDRARQVMSQIEKHSKIAIGLRKGKGKAIEQPTDPTQQLDIFS